MILAALLLQSAAPQGADLVYFDWGKDEISRDAQATLDSVAVNYTANPGPLVVSGFSDRSGPSTVNRATSLRRARAVADYLATKGVPRSQMTIEGRGEDALLVPTEDGVREVQNRRVEIRRR